MMADAPPLKCNPFPVADGDTALAVADKNRLPGSANLILVARDSD